MMFAGARAGGGNRANSAGPGPAGRRYPEREPIPIRPDRLLCKRSRRGRAALEGSACGSHAGSRVSENTEAVRPTIKLRA